MFRFGWGTRKRAANLLKHGLDFADAPLVLAGAHLIFPTKPGTDEQRFLAAGRIGADDVTLVYTEREGAIRVISLRRARHGKRKQRQAIHG
jgi:uncharacterized DUF497 family protein